MIFTFHLLVRADHNGTLQLGVICHNFLDGDGIQLFAIAKHNDIVGATIVDPMIRQGWMWFVKVFCKILVVVWESVEEALQARVLVLTDNYLFKDVWLACWAPLGPEEIGIDDEILP